MTLRINLLDRDTQDPSLAEVGVAFAGSEVFEHVFPLTGVDCILAV